MSADNTPWLTNNEVCQLRDVGGDCPKDARRVYLCRVYADTSYGRVELAAHRRVAFCREHDPRHAGHRQAPQSASLEGPDVSSDDPLARQDDGREHR